MIGDGLRARSDMKTQVLITGATGFIGRALCDYLLSSNYGVSACSRNPRKAQDILGENIEILPWDEGQLMRALDSESEKQWVIINLAGENLSSGLWTARKKKRILESRISSGKILSQVVEQCRHKPELLIQASAVGYYGSCGDDILDESAEAGKNFLADVVRQWEESTESVERLGIRRVIMRIGLVLGEGGVLSIMKRPFQLFFGGHLGKGNQWYSWIHLQDVLQAIQFFIENKSQRGVYNLVAPVAVRAKDFSLQLGRQLNRPSWFHTPSWILTIFLGQLAEETVLASQRVIPKKLTDNGFQFNFPELSPALRDIFRGA
ncbi:MAG: TIGR01777 family oxidoreductase [Calditrichia bacterium]